MIKEIDTKPTNETIVTMLQDMLVEAKNGGIQSIAIAGVYNDCRTFNCFDGNSHTISLIGEMRVLERDIVDLNVCIRKEVSWGFCE